MIFVLASACIYIEIKCHYHVGVLVFRIFQITLVSSTVGLTVKNIGQSLDNRGFSIPVRGTQVNKAWMKLDYIINVSIGHEVSENKLFERNFMHMTLDRPYKLKVIGDVHQIVDLVWFLNEPDYATTKYRKF